MKADPAGMRVYSGTSMYPTLREPDVMEIRPYRGRPIRAGDVILFHAPGRSVPIAHRVKSAAPNGIRTRGDNCRPPDEWLLSSDQVIGQVIIAHRGKRKRAVPNGNMGRVWAWWLRAWLPAGNAAGRILHLPYHALSGTGGLRRWVPSGWRPRKMLFQSDGRRIWRMVWGGQVVGEYEEGRGPWRIRRPFRLLIDPRDLDADR
jgi:signal peptidase I